MRLRAKAPYQGSGLIDNAGENVPRFARPDWADPIYPRRPGIAVCHEEEEEEEGEMLPWRGGGNVSVNSEE